MSSYGDNGFILEHNTVHLTLQCKAQKRLIVMSQYEDAGSHEIKAEYIQTNHNKPLGNTT